MKKEDTERWVWLNAELGYAQLDLILEETNKLGIQNKVGDKTITELKNKIQQLEKELEELC